MISEIIVLMNAISENSQLLRTLIADPQVPADQKAILNERILNNSATVRAIAESEVRND